VLTFFLFKNTIFRGFNLKKLAFLLIFLLPLFTFALDLVPQKIMLVVDRESKFSNLEFLLQKSILSKATSYTNFYLFSDDETELISYGIKEVNAKILILIKEETTNYSLNLIDVTKTTNFLTNFGFRKGEFIKEIEAISLNILEILAITYPPKEKRKIVTVETRKKKLGEFQKEKPSFSVGAGFNLDRFGIPDIEIEIPGGNQWGFKQDSVYSFASSLLFEFEYLWFLLILEAKTSITENYNYGISLTPAFGFFGNLFFFGPFARLEGGKYNSINLINGTINFTFPETEFYKLVFGLFFRFNVTKNYYFSLYFGVFQSGSLEFIFYDKTVTNVDFNVAEGPPYIHMDFDFKVSEKINFFLGINIYEIGIKREWNSSRYPEPFLIKCPEGEIYLKRLIIANSFVGLGIKYEF